MMIGQFIWAVIVTGISAGLFYVAKTDRCRFGDCLSWGGAWLFALVAAGPPRWFPRFLREGYDYWFEIWTASAVVAAIGFIAHSSYVHWR